MFNIFIFPRGKISPKSSSSRTAAAYGKGELHSWLISCLEVPWSEFWKGNYTTKQRKVKDNVGTSPSTVRARWISGTSAGIRPAWTAEIFFVTHICWLKSNASLGHSGKELEFFHWEVLSQRTGKKKKRWSQVFSLLVVFYKWWCLKQVFLDFWVLMKDLKSGTQSTGEAEAPQKTLTEGFILGGVRLNVRSTPAKVSRRIFENCISTSPPCESIPSLKLSNKKGVNFLSLAYITSVQQPQQKFFLHCKLGVELVSFCLS